MTQLNTCFHFKCYCLTSAAELAQGQLHEVEGPAHQHQDADVGDQEGAAPILVRGEGEPPDISKT